MGSAMERFVKKALFESLESRRFFSVVTPGNFSLAAATENTVKLMWADTSTGENRFRYESATSADFGMNRTTATVPMNSTEATISGLAPGMKYYVRVRAENGPTVSDYATLTVEMPLGGGQANLSSPFGKPTNVGVSEVTANSAKLSWQDNATAENRYRIMRSTSPTFDRDLWMATPGANSTSFGLTGLEAGKTYYVRVRAENGANVSEWGDVVTVKPIAEQPPVVATNLKVFDVFKIAGALKVTWTDNASNETGYVLERSLTADFASSTQITLPANATEYSDSGLAEWTAYYYRVKAVNGVGASAVSNSDWNRTWETEALPPILVDGAATDAFGTPWPTSTVLPGYIGDGYVTDNNARKGELEYVFWTSSEAVPYYRVRLYWPAGENLATNVKVTVGSQYASDPTFVVNLRANGGEWYDLGVFYAPQYVTISNADTDGEVVIDAVEFTPQYYKPIIYDFGERGGMEGWTHVNAGPNSGFMGDDYWVAQPGTYEDASALFSEQVNFGTYGFYEVYARFPASPENASNAFAYQPSGGGRNFDLTGEEGLAPKWKFMGYVGNDFVWPDPSFYLSNVDANGVVAIDGFMLRLVDDYR